MGEILIGSLEEDEKSIALLSLDAKAEKEFAVNSIKSLTRYVKLQISV
jgi:hypothetical protein